MAGTSHRHHQRHRPELGIVYRTLAGHLGRQAQQKQAAARTGAVTLIQRFGSALNLNVHLHMLFLDGVYVNHAGELRFKRVDPPSTTQLQTLLDRIAERIGRYLERSGWLLRDADDSHLQLERALAKASGFSLHAGVAISADDRRKLKRLCRYITRPALSNERLSLTASGQVSYTLKTPYRDGTTKVFFEPLDFIARLALARSPNSSGNRHDAKRSEASMEDVVD